MTVRSKYRNFDRQIYPDVFSTSDFFRFHRSWPSDLIVAILSNRVPASAHQRSSRACVLKDQTQSQARGTTLLNDVHTSSRAILTGGGLKAQFFLALQGRCHKSMARATCIWCIFMVLMFVKAQSNPPFYYCEAPAPSPKSYKALPNHRLALLQV